MHSIIINTLIGKLTLAEENGFLTHLLFGEVNMGAVGQWTQPTALLTEAEKQLEQYFTGKRKEFTLPIQAKGTAFRQEVWQALLTIPYGETISYKELANRVGNPKAIRAVGGANHNNPISIIIPCHRVIGTDGNLTGYGGGLETKRYLIQLEKGNEKSTGI